MLLFVDSFSHYDQTLMNRKWDNCEFGASGTTMAQAINSGRFGGGGLTFDTDFVPGATRIAYTTKTYNGVDTIIAGLAVQQTGLQYASPDTTSNIHGGRLLTFMSGNTIQVRLTILQSGQIEASRNNLANEGFFPTPSSNSKFTILGVSTNAIAASSYDFLEVKVVHDAATGSVEILRNGSAFWNLTGVNTDIANTGNSSSVTVGGGWWGTQSNQPLQDMLLANVSDFHLLNTDAVADTHNPTTFIGDRHWEVVIPTSDSTPLDWITTGSGTHALNVDEIPPNTTDYNSTATLNAEDALLFGALTGPTSASVLLSYTMYLQKDTGGAVGVSGLMVSPAGGGGTEGSGTEFQVPNPYAFRQSFLCTDPAAPGTNPLTVAIVNAAGHGYERTS